jgi:hypothetical protein
MRLGFHLEPESGYLASIRDRLREVLGGHLIGVYAGGSHGLGGYLPGRSDLDVAVVVLSPLTPKLGDAIASELDHDALPCPARCLELVVYLEATARSGSPVSDFELNLNTGRDIPLSVHWGSASGDVGGHWFAIDRSILSQAGIALIGAPAGDVFAPIPPAVLAPTLVESVRWHRGRGTDTGDAVLNACRALRYTQEGRWSSKPAAGRWAVEHRFAPGGLVTQALTARTQEGAHDAADVDAFLCGVEARLRRGFGGLGTL